MRGLHQSKSNGSTHFQVDFEPESDWLGQFRFELEQKLRAFKRSEQNLYDFCWKYRHKCEEEGKDVADLFAECCHRLELSPQIADRFRAWLRARQAVSATTAKKMEVSTGVHVGRYVSDAKLKEIATKAVKQNCTRGSQVRRLAAEVGGSKKEQAPRGPSLRQTVKRWRRELLELQSTRGLSRGVKDELKRVCSEMEGWIR